MGCEFAQGGEWNHGQALDWYVLDYPLHQGVQKLQADLSRLYRGSKALHKYDFDAKGFEWIDCHDAPQSVLSYLRRAGDEFAIVICNFTPVPRPNYRIGVPEAGTYAEVFNSDSEYYGGSNVGNWQLEASEKEWMGRPYSIVLTLPPLAAIVLTLKPEALEAIETDLLAEDVQAIAVGMQKETDEGAVPEDEA
jgi:1,4-alpha-glucan branching enzyme